MIWSLKWANEDFSQYDFYLTMLHYTQWIWKKTISSYTQWTWQKQTSPNTLTKPLISHLIQLRPRPDVLQDVSVLRVGQHREHKVLGLSLQVLNLPLQVVVLPEELCSLHGHVQEPRLPKSLIEGRKEDKHEWRRRVWSYNFTLIIN